MEHCVGTLESIWHHIYVQSCLPGCWAWLILTHQLPLLLIELSRLVWDIIQDTELQSCKKVLWNYFVFVAYFNPIFLFSVQDSFSEEKRSEVMAFTCKEILDHISDNLFTQTPQTLSDPKLVHSLLSFFFFCGIYMYRRNHK